MDKIVHFKKIFISLFLISTFSSAFAQKSIEGRCTITLKERDYGLQETENVNKNKSAFALSFDQVKNILHKKGYIISDTSLADLWLNITSNTLNDNLRVFVNISNKKAKVIYKNHTSKAQKRLLQKIKKLPEGSKKYELAFTKYLKVKSELELSMINSFPKCKRTDEFNYSATIPKNRCSIDIDYSSISNPLKETDNIAQNILDRKGYQITDPTRSNYSLNLSPVNRGENLLSYQTSINRRAEKKKFAKALSYKFIKDNQEDKKEALFKSLTDLPNCELIPPAKIQEIDSCFFSETLRPNCYHKRDKSELKVTLLYYGDHWELKDLDRIEPLLLKRFAKATNNKVTLNVISKKVISYKQKMPVGYTFKKIKDKKRLQRIFYGETISGNVLTEIYEEYKKVEKKEIMDEVDMLLTITGAQFEGLGLAYGRVLVTEHPREIAWNLEDGGRIELVSDYSIVDELIHELGHGMFLGHTSTQCQQVPPGPDGRYDDRDRCCDESPSKNDVLSYCRKREDVGENVMYGFEACNQDMIENLVVPAMLSGGKWKIQNRKKCK